MTDHDIVVAGASAPAAILTVPEGLVVELSTKLSLTDEQQEKALAAKRAHILHGLTAIQRARLMRDLREALSTPPPGGSGHNGWDSICRSDFDTNACDANREIAGLEAVEAVFSGEGGEGLARPTIPAEIGRSHLNEIGRLSDLEKRMSLAVLIRDGEVAINKRAIRKKADALKALSAKTTLKVQAPAAPAPTPTLPTPKRGEATSNKSTTKLSRSKYGNLPERDKELGYLLGSANANTKLDTDLVKLLRSASSTGKIARIKVLAAALHREFKAVGDRYQRSWDKDSGYPSYMTLWQHIWAEDDTFHLHAELEAVRKDISEANRYFSIANMRLFTEGLEIAE